MMASAPCSREPFSCDSHGPGNLPDKYFPQRLSCGSRSFNGDISACQLSSASLLADCAAPIHPFDSDDGFSELGSDALSSSSSPSLCSAQLSERHLFLCFKEPRSWPSVVEGADSDRLPRFLAAAIKTRKNEMMRKTRLIVCEGRDGTDTSNGDIMIFPDMVRYRGLTHFDVDAFVDEVLVRNRDWLPGRPEGLLGTHIFVCAHGNHEVKFGVLGPEIIQKFLSHIASQRLGSTVFVKPCSYLGGYKFARNLIVYSSYTMGEVLGHCYRCVTPDNVSSVLDDLYIKGHLPGVHDRLLDDENGEACLCSPTKDSSVDSCIACTECLAGHMVGDIMAQLNGHAQVHGQKNLERGQDSPQQRTMTYTSSAWWQASWWFCFWEKEDTLASLAVVGAAASVCLAYHLYKSHSRT